MRGFRCSRCVSHCAFGSSSLPAASSLPAPLYRRFIPCPERGTRSYIASSQTAPHNTRNTDNDGSAVDSPEVPNKFRMPYSYNPSVMMDGPKHTLETDATGAAGAQTQTHTTQEQRDAIRALDNLHSRGLPAEKIREILWHAHNALEAGVYLSTPMLLAVVVRLGDRHRRQRDGDDGEDGGDAVWAQTDVSPLPLLNDTSLPDLSSLRGNPTVSLLLKQIATRVRDEPETFSPHNISELLWAMIKCDMRPAPKLVSALAELALQMCDRFNSRQITNTLWAIAMASSHSHQQLVLALACRGSGIIDTFTAAQVTRSLAALARLRAQSGRQGEQRTGGISSEAVLCFTGPESDARKEHSDMGEVDSFVSDLVNRTRCVAGGIPSPLVSLLLSSLASLNAQSDELDTLLAELVAQIKSSHMPAFNATQLSSVLWALVTLGFPKDDCLAALLLDQVETLGINSLQGRDVARLLWGLAMWEVPLAKRVVEQFLTQVPHAPLASADFSLLLLATSRFGVEMPSLAHDLSESPACVLPRSLQAASGSGQGKVSNGGVGTSQARDVQSVMDSLANMAQAVAKSGNKRTNQVDPVLAQVLAGHALPLVHLFSAEQIALSLQALAVCGRWPETLVQALSAEGENKIRSFTPKDIALALRALASAARPPTSIAPSASLVRALLREALAKGTDFNARTMTHVLSALASLGVHRGSHGIDGRRDDHAPSVGPGYFGRAAATSPLQYVRDGVASNVRHEDTRFAPSEVSSGTEQVGGELTESYLEATQQRSVPVVRVADAFLREMVVQHKLSALRAQDVAMALSAIADLATVYNYQPSHGPLALSWHLIRLIENKQTVEAPHIATTLSSLHRCGLPPNKELVTALSAEAIRQAGTLRPKHIAAILMSLVESGFTPSEPLVNALAQTGTSRSRLFTARQTVDTLWTLASAGAFTKLTETLGRALWQEAWYKRSSLSGQDMCRALSALLLSGMNLPRMRPTCELSDTLMRSALSEWGTWNLELRPTIDLLSSLAQSMVVDAESARALPFSTPARRTQCVQLVDLLLAHTLVRCRSMQAVFSPAELTRTLQALAVLLEIGGLSQEGGRVAPLLVSALTGRLQTQRRMFSVRALAKTLSALARCKQPFFRQNRPQYGSIVTDCVYVWR